MGLEHYGLLMTNSHHSLSFIMTVKDEPHSILGAVFEIQLFPWIYLWPVAAILKSTTQHKASPSPSRCDRH